MAGDANACTRPAEQILSPLVAGSVWLHAEDRDTLSSAVERVIGDEGEVAP